MRLLTCFKFLIFRQLEENLRAKALNEFNQTKKLNNAIASDIKQKKDEYDDLNKEIFKLYKISEDNQNLIKNIEQGHFNDGKRVHYIPIKDKPAKPNRETYRYNT